MQTEKSEASPSSLNGSVTREICLRLIFSLTETIGICLAKQIERHSPFRLLVHLRVRSAVVNEGAKEDPWGRTAAEARPAESGAHVKRGRRFLWDSAASYVLFFHVIVISWGCFKKFVEQCWIRQPCLEFSDDGFAVPREGHNARPRPLDLDVAQERQDFGSVLLVSSHILRANLRLETDWMMLCISTTARPSGVEQWCRRQNYAQWNRFTQISPTWFSPVAEESPGL